MCGFKIKVGGNNFVPDIKGNNFVPMEHDRKHHTKEHIEKSKGLARGPMQNMGGQKQFHTVDSNKIGNHDHYKRKDNKFTGPQRNDASYHWQNMKIPNKIEAASNTGMDMKGFFNKSKGSPSPKRFGDMGMSQKKSLSKYFGMR